jgi:hypothetical protein
MEQKQTAVDWLHREILLRIGLDATGVIELIYIIEQAKQIEKEQIIDAWEDGYDNGVVFRAGWQQYYEFKYGKANQPI